jgi:hypothetical protein
VSRSKIRAVDLEGDDDDGQLVEGRERGGPWSVCLGIISCCEELAREEIQEGWRERGEKKEQKERERERENKQKESCDESVVGNNGAFALSDLGLGSRHNPIHGTAMQCTENVQNVQRTQHSDQGTLFFSFFKDGPLNHLADPPPNMSEHSVKKRPSQHFVCATHNSRSMPWWLVPQCSQHHTFAKSIRSHAEMLVVVVVVVVFFFFSHSRLNVCSRRLLNPKNATMQL